MLTYLILKLTFKGILDETNRMALEQEIRENIDQAKSDLMKLRMALESGEIDQEHYGRQEKELLRRLDDMMRLPKMS